MKKLDNANDYSTLRKILCITLVLSMTLGMLQPAMAMEKLINEISGAVSDDLLNMPLENLSPGENGKAVAISAGNDKVYVLLDDGTVWYYDIIDNSNLLITGECHWQDIWEDEYPNISEDPAILGTLYNMGIKSKPPNPNPNPTPFGYYVEKNYDYMGELLGLPKK